MAYRNAYQHLFNCFICKRESGKSSTRANLASGLANFPLTSTKRKHNAMIWAHRFSLINSGILALETCLRMLASQHRLTVAMSKFEAAA